LNGCFALRSGLSRNGIVIGCSQPRPRADLPTMEVVEEPFPRPESRTPRAILEAYVQGAEAHRVAGMEVDERGETARLL